MFGDDQVFKTSGDCEEGLILIVRPGLLLPVFMIVLSLALVRLPVSLSSFSRTLQKGVKLGIFIFRRRPRLQRVHPSEVYRLQRFLWPEDFRQSNFRKQN